VDNETQESRLGLAIGCQQSDTSKVFLKSGANPIPQHHLRMAQSIGRTSKQFNLLLEVELS